jgi:hypothetical protein
MNKYTVFFLRIRGAYFREIQLAGGSFILTGLE